MLTFFTIAGGVALLLFATRFLRDGFDRLVGGNLANWMQRLAASPGRAFVSGLAASVVAPSSTTMSVLSVQAVQAGHVTARQALVIMLGADIGLTLTVQLLAISLDAYAPLFVLVGVLLYQFTATRRQRGAGQVILGLGFLFLGVHIIKTAVSSAGPNPDLVTLLSIANNYPLSLALIAAVTSLLLQSSTATIGLILAIAAAPNSPIPLSLTFALPVVAGANVGVAVTTLVVGWNRTESRRLALANLLAKAGAAALLLAFTPILAAALAATPGTMANHVANAHTGLNILKALLALPLVVPLYRLAEALIPAPANGEQPAFGPRYINYGPFDGPTLAMAQSAREIMHAAEIVRSMLDDLWRALKTNDENLVRAISERDNQVDLLDAEIKKFLAHQSTGPLEPAELSEQLRQLRYLAELESIGDIIDKNLCRLAIKKINLGVNFDQAAWTELDDFDQKVRENMLLADTAFQTRDRVLAEKLLRHKDHIGLQIRQLRDQHFAALAHQSEATYEASAIHLDLLTNLKRINSHVTHVAYTVLYDLDNPAAPATEPAT